VFTSTSEQSWRFCTKVTGLLLATVDGSEKIWLLQLVFGVLYTAMSVADRLFSPDLRLLFVLGHCLFLFPLGLEMLIHWLEITFL